METIFNRLNSGLNMPRKYQRLNKGQYKVTNYKRKRMNNENKKNRK